MFKYKQFFDFVIFRKAYFLNIQRNTDSHIKSLEVENNKLLEELRALKSGLSANVRGNEDIELIGDLRGRIQTLQSIIKDDRAIYKKKLKHLEDELKVERATVKRLEVSVKSSNLLIKDLWLGLKRSLSKAQRTDFYKRELEQCKKEKAGLYTTHNKQETQIEGLESRIKATIGEIGKFVRKQKELPKEVVNKRNLSIDLYT